MNILDENGKLKMSWETIEGKTGNQQIEDFTKHIEQDLSSAFHGFGSLTIVHKFDLCSNVGEPGLVEQVFLYKLLNTITVLNCNHVDVYRKTQQITVDVSGKDFFIKLSAGIGDRTLKENACYRGSDGLHNITIKYGDVLKMMMKEHYKQEVTVTITVEDFDTEQQKSEALQKKREDRIIKEYNELMSESEDE